MVVSRVSDGDLGPRSDAAGEVLDARRRAVVPGAWRWLNQVHGDHVVTLGPSEACQGREGDALVSTAPGAPIAVFAADCALVGLASPEGVLGAAHAGWRGLLAGVLESAVTAMRAAAPPTSSPSSEHASGPSATSSARPISSEWSGDSAPRCARSLRPAGLRSTSAPACARRSPKPT